LINNECEKRCNQGRKRYYLKDWNTGKSMKVLVNLLLYIIIIIEYLSFYYVIFGKRRSGKNCEKNVIITVVNIVVICCVIYINRLDTTLILALIASVVNIVGVYHLLWLESINLFLIAFPLLTILESVIEYFLNYFIKIDADTVSVIYTFGVIALLWIYYFSLGRKIERNAFVLKPKMNIIISIPLFIITAMLSFFTYSLTEILNTKQGILGLGLVMVGSGVLFIAFLLMIYYFNVQQKYLLENEILEKYNEQQKKHFEVLLEKEQKTRQFRHDIIAELIQIKNYSVKKDYTGLEKYITDTLNDINLISKYDYDVGNEAVNVILNYYLLPMNNKCKIEVKGYISDSLAISDRDIGLIVSNLIVNAIEAVEKVHDSKKYISFTIKKGKIYTYIIEKNSYSREEKLYENKFATTKRDKKNHGFGLKNIKNIVRKYNGEFMYKKEENQFYAEIRIKNNLLSSK
jgi:hypothetical protein